MRHIILLPYGKYLWLINTSSRAINTSNYPGNKVNQEVFTELWLEEVGRVARLSIHDTELLP